MQPRAGLSVGDTLNEMIGLYQRYFGVLIPAAFWLFLIVSILSGIVGQDDPGLLLVVEIAILAITVLYQGMVVSLVHAVHNGKESPSVGELFRAVQPVFWPLLGASLLYGIGVAIGFVLIIVPGCILLAMWAVLAPAIVIERRPIGEAFSRSRALVSGYGWPVFGTVITALVINLIVGLVLVEVAEAIAGGPILRTVFTALASTFTAPIGGLVTACLYYRLLTLKGEAAPAPAADPAGP
jgi:hypothetical protein